MQGWRSVRGRARVPRPVWLWVGCALALLSLLIRIQTRLPPEPTHQGRPLSAWLATIDEEPLGGWLEEHYDNDLELLLLATPIPRETLPPEPEPAASAVAEARDPTAWDETAAALRAMGADSVPHLLALLRDRATWWDRLRMALWERLSYRWLYPEHAVEADRNVWRAQVAFRVLGEAAAGAVPELARRLQRPGCDLRLGVLLAGMGPAGQGVLTNALLSPHPSVRNAAAAGLLEEGVPPRFAVPALKELLRRGSVSYWTLAAVAVNRQATTDFIEPLAALLAGQGAGFEDSRCRRMVICLLGLYGPDAMAAVPALLQAAGQAGDTERSERYYIGRALVRIDAEAAGRFEMEEAARAATLKSR